MNIPISWVLIAAAVLIALGGFLTWSVGNSRYKEGLAVCQSVNDQVAAVKNDDARKTKEKSYAEEKAIPDAGTDAELLKLGILRPD